MEAPLEGGQDPEGSGWKWNCTMNIEKLTGWMFRLVHLKPSSFPAKKNKRKFVILRIPAFGICKHNSFFVIFKIKFGTRGAFLVLSTDGQRVIKLHTKHRHEMTSCVWKYLYTEKRYIMTYVYVRNNISCNGLCTE